LRGSTHETTRDGIGCGDFEVRKIGFGEGYEQVGGKTAREARAAVAKIVGEGMTEFRSKSNKDMK
jgi:hypothetical protein